MIEALGEYAGVDRRLWPVESSGVAARLMLSAAWGNPPYPLGYAAAQPFGSFGGRFLHFEVLVIDSVAELLRLHEGYRKHPYQCTAGKTTIGIGRNLDDVGIDEDEASYLLSRDIDRAIRSLRFEPYWLDLSPVRQAVLIDMCVNLGWTRFQGFRMLRGALNQGDIAEACKQMVNSHWYSQVGDRAKRLVGMMASDRWPVA